MAPLPTDPSVRDLTLSSLELDSRTSPIDLPAYPSSLSLPELELLNTTPPSNGLTKRTTTPNPHLLSNPLIAHAHLTARNPAPPSAKLGSGAVPPNSINMKGIQALFALIGLFFVVVGIWFFFWAKNGGFKWRKGDWEDYKSTVLRRKGPDGKTLSNATKSTKLGGGSVVASGYSDEDGTMTELSSEAPIIKEKAHKKGKNGKKAGKGIRGGGRAEKNKAQKQRQQKEERWEGRFDDDVRAYRHEKPAKIGGMNRDSDAQFYGTDYSETDPSSFGGGGQRQPGHRQSSRQSSPDKYHSHPHPPPPPHHHHSSPQRQSRRDFSYGNEDAFTVTSTHSSTTMPPPAAAAARPTRYASPSKPATAPRSAASRQSTIPGSYVEPLDFDNMSQGTKSYHHPIPGLSAAANAGGFRKGGRGRRDSLDDSD